MSRSRSRRRRWRGAGITTHSVTGCATIGYMEAATATDTPFSLELSQDQRDIRDWVHGFAEGVVRPAAAEWDEREETPWPVIAEATKIGLYGYEALAQFWADETRPDAADRQRGALLGRRRHRHGDHGHLARRRGHLRPGHRRADRRVDPAVLRHGRRAGGRGLLRLRARRRLGRLLPAHARGLRRGRRTSGSSTARRRGRPTAGSPACTWSSPRSTASSARAARPRSSCRPAPRA